jgi:hypothetical protein
MKLAKKFLSRATKSDLGGRAFVAFFYFFGGLRESAFPQPAEVILFGGNNMIFNFNRVIKQRVVKQTFPKGEFK